MFLNSLKNVLTTGKMIMKKFTIFLSLVLIISILSSCAVDNSAMLDELMDAVSEIEDDEQYHYSIIIPSNASQTLQ